MKKLLAKEIPENVSEIAALQAKGFERGRPIYRGIDRETGEECYIQTEGSEAKPWWLYTAAEKSQPRGVSLSPVDSEELPEHMKAPEDPEIGA